DGTEPLQEQRDRGKAQRHMPEGYRRRLGREQPKRRTEPFRILRSEPALDTRRERRGTKPEVARGLAVETLAQPRRRLLHAPVVGETARQLLSRLLRLELRQLELLLREEAARLQLQERRDEHEELAAGVEIEPPLLLQPGAERQHDLGDVDLGRL